MTEQVNALKTVTLEDGSLLQVTKERVNKVIGRVEVEGVITHMGKGTPPRQVVIDALAKLYSKDVGLVVIKYIKSEFGMGRSKLKAHIYDSVERLNYFEPEYILKRGKKSGGEA